MMIQPEILKIHCHIAQKPITLILTTKPYRAYEVLPHLLLFKYICHTPGQFYSLVKDYIVLNDSQVLKMIG